MDMLRKIKYSQNDYGSGFAGDRRLSFDCFYMTTNPDTNQSEFEAELAQLVATALNLDINPAEIDPVAPLFGDAGLGMDSIDILEISLEISKQYGIQLRSDDENSKQIFASLRDLANHIQQHRTK